MTEQPAVVLENSVIQSLLRRPEVVQAFPFMQQAAAQMVGSKGKGKQCCGKKNRNNTADYEGLKQAIAQMGLADLVRLRDFIGASQVRLVYRNFRGQVVRKTF
jgi:hypothetical protein